MSDIEKRLRASVALDAVNGSTMERAVCARQMAEAADELRRLQAGHNEELKRPGGYAAGTCPKHQVPWIYTITDRVYCAVCEAAKVEQLRAIADELRKLACDMCSEGDPRNEDGHHLIDRGFRAMAHERCDAWTEIEAAKAAGGGE